MVWQPNMRMNHYAFKKTKNTEIIRVFQRQGRVSSTFSNMTTGFPKEVIKMNMGMWNLRIVEYLNPCFGGLRSDGKILVGHEACMHEYKLNEDEWIHIKAKPRASYDGCSKGCMINDLALICGGGLQNKVKVLQVRKMAPFVAALKSKMKSLEDKLISITERKNQNCSTRNTYLYDICPTTMPLVVHYGHTIIATGTNCVMLLGGVLNSQVSNRVFQGELTENRKDVTWTELKSMETPRYFHVSFKMQNAIYVVGGLTENNRGISGCERYDIKQNVWLSFKHSLKFPLFRASVVVSADESFAIITGGKRGGEYRTVENKDIIIFTKQEGFQHQTKNSKNSRMDHISIRLQ